MPPHLIIMDKVVLLGVFKMKCVYKTQMMPPPDYKKIQTSQKFFNTMYDALSYSISIQIVPLILHSWYVYLWWNKYNSI